MLFRSVYLCDGTNEVVVSGPELGDEDHPAASCRAIVAQPGGGSRENGFYWLLVGGVATQRYCLTTGGGIELDAGVARSATNNPPTCAALWMAFPATTNAASLRWINGVRQTCDPTWDVRVPADGLVAWFKMENYFTTIPRGRRRWDSVNPADYSHKKLSDGSSMPAIDRTVIFAGSLPASRTGGGRGAHSTYKYLQGSTQNNRMNFGDIVGSTFTLCTTSRYNGRNRKRIFVGSRRNWLHGHWGGRVGMAYYNGWITDQRSKSGDVGGTYNWLVFCSTNGGARDIWMNDRSRPFEKRTSSISAPIRSTTGTTRIQVGWRGLPAGACCEEHSDYALAEVIAWDRGFSSTELQEATEYLTDRVKLGTTM